jgi:hypothetical protein
MIRFGLLLAVLGFGSAIMHFTDVQFRLLMWSEPMQPTLGIVIGAVGAVLLVVKVITSKDEDAQPQQAGPPAGQQQAFAQGAPQSYGPPSGPQQFGPPQAQPPYGAPQGQPQNGQQSFGPQGPQQQPYGGPRN